MIRSQSPYFGLPTPEPVDARRFGVVADGATDNYAALLSALSWGAANNQTLMLPSGLILCGQQLVISSAGNVSVVGSAAGNTLLKFTNASSAGLSLTLRAYNALTGVIDRVFMADFTICPGAVHTDAAIKVIYTAHTANAETPVLIRNVAVRPHGVFGTNKFAKGFHGSKIYNGLIERFSFIGATSVSDAGIYLNNCISVNCENPDITYAAKAIHVTTGDGGVAQEQSEGIHVQNGVLYNVEQGVVVDGLSSMGQNALDIRVCNTHISATTGEPVHFTEAQQSAVTNSVFYTSTATKSGVVDSSGFGNIYGFNQILNLGGAGSGSVGVDLQGATGAALVWSNYVAGYETGLKFGSSTISNTYGGNTLIGNTTPITDGGTNNINQVNAILAAGGSFSSLSGVTGTNSFVLADKPTLTSFKMLQDNSGAFAGGEWSRDSGWGTYYKAPAAGSNADIALFDSNGRGGIYAGSFGTVISYDTGSARASGISVAATTGITTIAQAAIFGGYLQGAEQTAPSAPASNGYRIFAQDNGAGKTQLMVLFSSGVAQQIAIQP